LQYKKFLTIIQWGYGHSIVIVAKRFQIFGCIHGWGTTIKTMTPICLVSWVLKQGISKINIILNNEMGYVFLGFQPINVIMNDSNQLNIFWMSYSWKYKYKCKIT